MRQQKLEAALQAIVLRFDMYVRGPFLPDNLDELKRCREALVELDKLAREGLK
jgi:hypothetical protein